MDSIKTREGKQMQKNLTKSDIAKYILDEDLKSNSENEEIIHMLLKKTVSQDINSSNKEHLTLGDRVADKMAEVAGSWAFIISFCLVLIFWIVLNSYLLTKPYDPYPFILLNLVLSCVAAIQAPIIMMSQNRQDKKDRLSSENDYRVNLKSEVIVEDLHIKLDTLISNQDQILQRLEALEKKNNDNR